MHRRGITKECLHHQPVGSNDEGYHALHHVTGGRRFVSGWSRDFADLYPQIDPPSVHETFRVVDPLFRLARELKLRQAASVTTLRV